MKMTLPKWLLEYMAKVEKLDTSGPVTLKVCDVCKWPIYRGCGCTRKPVIARNQPRGWKL